MQPKIGTAQLSNTPSIELTAVQLTVRAPAGCFVISGSSKQGRWGVYLAQQLFADEWAPFMEEKSPILFKIGLFSLFFHFTVVVFFVLVRYQSPLILSAEFIPVSASACAKSFYLSAQLLLKPSLDKMSTVLNNLCHQTIDL